MKKRKHQHKNPYRDPNNQVHSEFETSIGNNFKTVAKESPAKNENEADLDDPLNEVPGDEYDLINEWDISERPPQKSVGEKEKVDRLPLLIGLIGLIGAILVIGVAKSLRVNRLTT
ncbi:hypothetical protein A4H97_18420 [Niastella yeongjuensis]|uniref:Uncharacterized protein n=1 Tax=Niastella yeongjuensis TaxID=354355 RepID=A0A1V9DY52_9BACT|nr:hypothetical protein [Niastella yeongjuensis]OQP38694.1 hypothetical protein A4H97_18420 [Niastella yeongjuensis]SEO36087.1 hypothetical protein SAMN05660816_02718 [Niastella yeongjuensis]